MTAALLSAPPSTAPWRAESFSTTDPRGVLSLGANPAGLAWMQGWEGAVETSNGGDARRSAVLAGNGPFALGWTSTPGPFGLREQQWILGAGFELPGGFGIGAKAERRRAGGAVRGWSGDLGAIWRPFPLLSLGWDWEDVDQRDPSRWSGHGLAAAVRPFGDPSLAVGVESWLGRSPLSGKAWEQAVVEYGAEIRPIPWLAANLRWIPDRDDAWSFGLSARLNSHARLFSRTAPGPDGGSLQGVGLHVTGSALEGAMPSVPPGSFLYHVGKLQGEAGEDGFLRSTKGFSQVREDLLHLAARDEVRVVVIDLGSGAMKLAEAGQLRRLVLGLRATGKKVVVWSQDLTMASMHVMSAADKAAISPLGTVRSRGLAVRRIYAGSALRDHGIDVEVVRTGRWKSALEPYIADAMSEEARSDLETHLHDLDSMILGGVALGRSVDPYALVRWVDSGSMLPVRAVRAGILDTLVEPQDLMAWAAPGTRPVAMALAKPGTEVWGTPRRVAVVSLEGQIVDGKGGLGMVPWGRNLAADEVVGILHALRDDAAVGGVVLRVNSPGGSVVGSERIRVAVAELDARKPVVASFAGVAASGAYLFSLPARRIWTEPEAMVGSIGVFTARVSAVRLLDSLGLHVETVATGPSAGSSSLLARIEPAESARIREQVEDAHRQFADRVRDARHLDSARFESVDGGRVFTGVRAVGNGLADTLGGLDDAVRWVEDLVQLPRRDPILIAPESDKWERLVSRMEASAKADPWSRIEPLLRAPATSMWAQVPYGIEEP